MDLILNVFSEYVLSELIIFTLCLHFCCVLCVFCVLLRFCLFVWLVFFLVFLGGFFVGPFFFCFASALYFSLPDNSFDLHICLFIFSYQPSSN